MKGGTDLSAGADGEMTRSTLRTMEQNIGVCLSGREIEAIWSRGTGVGE